MIKILVKGASGKMGQRILAVARGDKNFQVVEAIDSADVLIDFSHPEATIPNLELAAKAKKAAVIGTTGHSPEERPSIERFASKLPFVFAPNMSIGVNVMWKILQETARLLGKDYQVEVHETHHIHKKDSPSGTAKKIAEILAKALETTPEKILVESHREGEVVGDHTTTFTGPHETLEITHRAHSRDVFAIGALRAAQWILGKPNGIYSMADVLGLTMP